MEKQLGKITNVRFGRGGYQDVQFGLSLTFEGKSWGCGTIITGGWAYGHLSPDKHTKWTEEDRTKSMAEMCQKIDKVLGDAGVDDVAKLKNMPVEVTFDGNTMKDWRILKEVL